MKTPFVISPSPYLLYLTPSFKKAHLMITSTLDNRQGLSCILGDVGMGKSSLLRSLHSEYLSRDEAVAVLIPGSDFKRPFGLLKRICDSLGIPPCRSSLDYTMALEKYLVDLDRTEGKYVAVFLDEAEGLDTYMLDLIRNLLNFETSEKKLIQFVLAGALPLHERLIRKRNRAFRSRVLYMNFLEPLSLEETIGMIGFRCDRLDIPNSFTRTGMEKIHELSKGVPRRILAVASAAYDLRALAQADKLDSDFVVEAYALANHRPDNAEVAYG